jgi:hypothetical protein
MSNSPHLGAILVAAFALLHAAPAFAAGEILLTHAKALAGNVTPGDASGYPITLSLPGAYQFAGNIHPTANTIGISIGSDDVTIDLNGFRLHGSTTALFGIAGSAKSVTIRNGTVTGFRFDGIYGTGDFWDVDNMRVVENGRTGIACDQHAQIRNSTISENAGSGIICSSGTIQNNVVNGNSGNGIVLNRGIVQNNMVDINSGDGIDLNYGLAVNNSVTANGAIGIAATDGLGTAISVLGNAVAGNTSWGVSSAFFYGFGDNLLRDNNGASAENTGNALELHPNGCDPACQ